MALAATRSSDAKRSSEQLREVVQGDEAPFVAFIEGEAGIGKTALLEAIKARGVGAGSAGAAGAADRGRGGELVRGARRPAARR